MTQTQPRPARAAAPVQGRGFIAATVSFVSVFAAGAAAIPLNDTYHRADGLTNSQFSLAAVAYFVCAVFALLVLGRLSSHHGRRPVSIAALLIAAAGWLTLLAVHSFLPLLVGRSLQGLAAGLASSAIGAYIVDTPPPAPAVARRSRHHRGRFRRPGPRRVPLRTARRVCVGSARPRVLRVRRAPARPRVRPRHPPRDRPPHPRRPGLPDPPGSPSRRRPALPAAGLRHASLSPPGRSTVTSPRSAPPSPPRTSARATPRRARRVRLLHGAEFPRRVPRRTLHPRGRPAHRNDLVAAAGVGLTVASTAGILRLRIGAGVIGGIGIGLATSGTRRAGPTAAVRQSSSIKMYESTAAKTGL